MSAGYMIARENFKEASRHVSAEADPVMFNLLYGLQSLTNQIEADFAALRLETKPTGGERASARKSRVSLKKTAKKKTMTKAESKAKSRKR
ncbi:hypothetical protein [Bradyrhizobium genosp. A]|uniref:hypothetical protein n=1 Tax=Bradyrhizobium genosp. A TaxID=83626 RepID=UPI003CEE126B